MRQRGIQMTKRMYDRCDVEALRLGNERGKPVSAAQVVREAVDKQVP